ncbi:hypothetical protein E1264_01575 [Actinomadura sp. KC216]|uniref:hypothetical protein n=1 Tax=Actinomadura sp. KC216 TaxID=2530370 RepID=UPI001046CD26|nr:hypothetical protein [Actinomadura sp. KC216]TDB91505.1 hypothetical protein E1264_01575 [Actinomadura sp. KC216]
MTELGGEDVNQGPSPRVLILAMDPRTHKRDYRRVAGLAAHFLDEEGAQVEVVTAESSGWTALDERARLHPIDRFEARHPLPWLEHTIVSRVPRAVVWPFIRLGRPGAVLDRVQRRVSGAVHRRLFVVPFYRHVRPLLLSRIARRRVLPGIDMARVSRVIVIEDTSVPFARRLARRYPDLTVTTRQTRTLEPEV